MTAFHAALDTPLLSFGRQEWCIRDAAEGTAIWGAPGSGKTSGSGQTIAKAMLLAGMGGVVLCAKSDECATWLRYAEETGREDDVIVLDASGRRRFNFLDYAARTFAAPGFEQNLTHLMARMAEASRVANDAGDSGENRFFTDNAMRWISHAFPLLRLAYGTIKLRDLDRFITSIAQTPDEITDPAKYRKWVAGSFCGKTHVLAGERAMRAQGAEKKQALQTIQEHGEFFLEAVPRLDNRPRTGIEATIGSLIFPFLTGKLSELFCTSTTVTPEMAREGKIIILDVPVMKYGAAGAIGQTLFKYLFGLEVQRAAATDDTRPVFLYADEAQFFMNSADADLLSTARSSKTCIVYITQDLPTYYAKLGANAKDTAESMLSKFGTRIFHANSSRETNMAAAELVGKIEKFHIGRNVTRSTNAGGGTNRHDQGGNYSGQDGFSISSGRSSSGYLDYEIPPDYFAKDLRTGSKGNGFKVDGIVVRTGKNWRTTGKHWVKGEFDQRCAVSLT